MIETPHSVPLATQYKLYELPQDSDQRRSEMKCIVRGVATATLTLANLLSAASAADAPGPQTHSLPFKPWMNGVSAGEPQMQVQRYDDDTYVIRQSIRTNFEGPFLYVLFGNDRALLIDTGAGGLKVRPTIDRLIAEWAARHHRSIPLVVAHSHSHGDHHQGDVEFKDRPDTTVVGLYPKDVADFFKIADWPNQIVSYDLGGRVLDVIPTPGHQSAHIMLFDRKTRLLLSGDSLGPYRLYIPMNEAKSYRESIERVAAFVRDKNVSWILGAHIEMTTKPGELIPDEAPSHPDERVLEISYSNLPELQAALHAMGDGLVLQAHRDFVIFPIPAREPQPFAPPPN
jgi:glyoxylase-like metal-dependent hydrolase (beta-lactamase superfamily II)